MFEFIVLWVLYLSRCNLGVLCSRNYFLLRFIVSSLQHASDIHQHDAVVFFPSRESRLCSVWGFFWYLVSPCNCSNQLMSPSTHWGLVCIWIISCLGLVSLLWVINGEPRLTQHKLERDGSIFNHTNCQCSTEIQSRWAFRKCIAELLEWLMARVKDYRWAIFVLISSEW